MSLSCRRMFPGLDAVHGLAAMAVMLYIFCWFVSETRRCQAPVLRLIFSSFRVASSSVALTKLGGVWA